MTHNGPRGGPAGPCCGAAGPGCGGAGWQEGAQGVRQQPMPCSTLLLRNVPLEYKQDELIHEVGEALGIQDYFDFFHLPLDAAGNSSGHAIINFPDLLVSQRAFQVFANYHFWLHPHSGQVGQGSPAQIQGLENNIRHIQDTCMAQGMNFPGGPIVVWKGQRVELIRVLSQLWAQSPQEMGQHPQHPQQQQQLWQQQPQHFQQLQQARQPQHPQPGRGPMPPSSIPPNFGMVQQQGFSAGSTPHFTNSAPPGISATPLGLTASPPGSIAPGTGPGGSQAPQFPGARVMNEGGDLFEDGCAAGSAQSPSSAMSEQQFGFASAAQQMQLVGATLRANQPTPMPGAMLGCGQMQSQVQPRPLPPQRPPHQQRLPAVPETHAQDSASPAGGPAQPPPAAPAAAAPPVEGGGGCAPATLRVIKAPSAVEDIRRKFAAAFAVTV